MSLESMWDGFVKMPEDVREAYKETQFSCECGGTVIPQTMSTGKCFSCKEVLQLADLDYEEI